MSKTALFINLTFKAIILVLTVTFGLAFLLVGAKAALAASIKPISSVEHSTLKVGDLFSGISEDKASYVLGTAPHPGSDMVIDAVTLKRVASAMEISWHPSSASDQVVVRRAATVIATSDIEALLKEHLVERGISGKFNVSYTGKAPQIILPQDQPASFELDRLSIDHNKNLFEASFAAPSLAAPMAQITFTGKLDRLSTVPVLASIIKAGEIIGAPDIAWLEISNNKLQKDTILKADELIGMTPRRIIELGRAIKITELQAPILVNRGDNVILLLKTGTLELSAQGRAQQNGAKGDIVRVVNNNSKRSIEGIVTGDREVTILN